MRNRHQFKSAMFALIHPFKVLLATCLFIPVITITENCPKQLADICTCGQEVHQEEVVKVVRCSGITSRDLPKLHILPVATQLLVVKNSNFEDVTGNGFNFFSQSLTILHLDHNSIQDFHLERFLCAHRNLERLYLTDNTLIEFTIDPQCSGNLKYLSLKQNHIHFIRNDTLAALEKLENLEVDLSGNTFSCDCNLVPTVRFLQRNESQGQRKGASILSPELYTCRDAFPETLMGRQLIDLDPDQLKCQYDPGFKSEEDMEFYNYHSHLLYFMIGFMGLIALLLAIFTIYLNFSNVLTSAKNLRNETPRISNNKRYESLNNETQA